MSEITSDVLESINARLTKLEAVTKDIRSLVGPFGTVFPDGTMLVQTIHGTKYFIDPLDEIMAPQLVIYRQWEPDLSAFISHSVDGDSIFVDVGANFGYFTCLAASKIGKAGSGRVIAFEPNPKMQKLLRKNIKINWSMAPVAIYECAVTSGEGFVEFSVPADRAANASIKSEMSRSEDNRFIVKSNSLDNLLGNISVDLMKIDVEGFEAGVLQGAEKIIAQSKNIHIVMEWSLEQMRAAGFAVPDIIALIQKYGFHAYHIPRSKSISAEEWSSIEIPLDQLQYVGYDNIILKRK